MRNSKYRKIPHTLSIANINIVPYVDVMLVLIVILLASASSLLPKVIQLPKIGQKSAALKNKSFILSVHADGRIQLPKNEQLQTLDQAIILLKQQENINILIAGDKNVRYDIIMQTMSRLKQMGFDQVGLLVNTNNNTSSSI
jgi:biopolymer transport protein TolR